jgi:hypothetical protein
MKKQIRFRRVFLIVGVCTSAIMPVDINAQGHSPNVDAIIVGSQAHGSNDVVQVHRKVQDQHGDDMSPEVRIASFLMELAVTLPTLAGDTDTLNEDQLYAQMNRTSQARYIGSQARDIALRDGSGWAGYAYTPLVPWIDSVAQTWQAADTFARTAWCLRKGISFTDNFGRALFQLTEHPEYLPAIERVADASMTFAARTRNVERADAFRSLGELLHGGVALARGDSIRAMQAFRATFQWPRTPSVKSAVQSFALLAQKRSSPSDRFVAQALLHLLRDPSVKLGGGGALRRLYHDMVAGGHAPPDIFPERMRHDPAPSYTMSLDAYLDRQWAGLFDRTIPIGHIVTPPQSGGLSRLTIVEYATGIGCEGCWVEDIGLQSLARRYSSDQVLTLAWHGHAPLATGSDQMEWWGRYNDWYPRLYNASGAKSDPGTQRIPVQSLITLTGDTLTGAFARVNGHGLPRQSETVTVYPDVSLHQRVIPVIERERARAPDATLQMTVDTHHDSVTVHVAVDSIRGIHRTLVMRIALFADTIWKRGGNDRRIYTNVVQDAAHDDTLELGLPLGGRVPVALTYSFDLAEIQKSRWLERDRGLTTDSANLADMEYRMNYPDPRDWDIDRTRLHVAAFVQDLDTGDILQAVQAKVPIIEATGSMATTENR